MNVQAIAMTDVGRVEFLETTLPEPEQGELLIRTEVTAVSPGTELRCLAGLQRNSEPFPFISGYSLVGIVESAPKGSAIPVGTRVFAAGTKRAGINRQWGGHISFALADAQRVWVVPEGCRPELAALGKLAGIAKRGCYIAQPKTADKVAVVGLGPIGLLSLRMFHATGAQVLGVDQVSSRVERARAGGIAAEVVGGTIEATVRAHFGTLADIVVDATGIPAVLPLALAAAREPSWDTPGIKGSKLVLQGSYPNEFTLPYDGVFRKEIQMLVPRDTTPDLVKESIDLIASGKCHVEDLLSWFGPASEGPEAFARLQSDKSYMTVGFDWRS